MYAQSASTGALAVEADAVHDRVALVEGDPLEHRLFELEVGVRVALRDELRLGRVLPPRVVRLGLARQDDHAERPRATDDAAVLDRVVVHVLDLDGPGARVARLGVVVLGPETRQPAEAPVVDSRPIRTQRLRVHGVVVLAEMARAAVEASEDLDLRLGEVGRRQSKVVGRGGGHNPLLTAG